MTVDPALRDQLLAAIPNLRACAYSLTYNWDRADDFVQDALVRAWGKLDQFEPGTNLHAWLFAIVRNVVYSEQRKRKREVEDPDGAYATRLQTHADQPSHLDFEDFRKALAHLTPSQREALLLVAVEGLSYEESAAVCGVALGTIKSRVYRAREQLTQLLAFDAVEDIGLDRVTRAAVQR